MDEKLRLLRNAINDSTSARNEIYQRKDGSWDRLWAAMDALEDAQEAVKTFLTKRVVSYLELYGLLQAFVVQQDAINHIRQTVLGNARISWSTYPELKANRDLRNETVGHPAEITRGKSTLYCNIDRSSISNVGFHYILWTKTGPVSHDVNLKNCVDTQSEGIEGLIDDTIDEINKKDLEFMARFKDSPVRPKYDEVVGYHFEKIHAFNDQVLGLSMLNSLEKIFIRLKKMLEDRYGSFQSTINAPGLIETCKDIEEGIARLHRSFENGKPDDFLHRVLVNQLEQDWKELGAMVDETDKKFSQ